MSKDFYKNGSNASEEKTGGGGKRYRVCACCKRELSLTHFYLSGVRSTPDRYCKECRRRASSRYRDGQSMERVGKVFHSRRSIMELEDRALRLSLILAAKKVVRESIRRRYLRDSAAEDARTDRELSDMLLCLPDGEIPPSSQPESPEETEHPSPDTSGEPSDEKLNPSEEEEPWQE